MKPDRAGYRLWLVAAVLILALLAGWWANRDTVPERLPPRPLPAPAGIPAPPPAKTLPPAQHAAAGNPAGPQNVVDIFAAHTWEPPPPPLAAAAPQVRQAPPLPFRFMGRIAEPGKAPVFLLVQGDRVLPVMPGQRIGAAYRLEKFEGGKLFFRYQPMNLVQTLAVGGVQ